MALLPLSFSSITFWDSGATTLLSEEGQPAVRSERFVLLPGHQPIGDCNVKGNFLYRSQWILFRWPVILLLHPRGSLLEHIWSLFKKARRFRPEWQSCLNNQCLVHGKEESRDRIIRLTTAGTRDDGHEISSGVCEASLPSRLMYWGHFFKESCSWLWFAKAGSKLGNHYH